MFSLTKFVAKIEQNKIVAQIKADGAADAATIVEGIFADLEAGKSPTVVVVDALNKVKADALIEYQKSLVAATPVAAAVAAVATPVAVVK